MPAKINYILHFDLSYILFLLSYICTSIIHIHKMQKNIKYCQRLEEPERSFIFEHVRVAWYEQVTLHLQQTWELSYVITGKGVRVIGDKVEPFSAGVVILIPPDIPHKWSFDESIADAEGKIENITIIFTDVFLENCKVAFPELQEVISEVQWYKHAIRFRGELLKKLQSLLRSMIAETDIERASSMIRLLTLLAAPDNGNMSDAGHPIREDKKARRMQQVYLYVMNNYQRDITLEEVAQAVGMEKSSFCVFFKKMMGKSFFAFLMEYRIESSCQMLQKTHVTISEACLASGFRDVPYYNRVFRKLKGMTPTQYREQIL